MIVGCVFFFFVGFGWEDLLHTFSYLPRDLNFIDHTSDIGWKEWVFMFFLDLLISTLWFFGEGDWFLWRVVSLQRARPIIIDPGLYNSKKQDVFWVTQRRSRPTAFKLFTGEDPFLVSLCCFLRFLSVYTDRSFSVKQVYDSSVMKNIYKLIGVYGEVEWENFWKSWDAERKFNLY